MYTYIYRSFEHNLVSADCEGATTSSLLQRRKSEGSTRSCQKGCGSTRRFSFLLWGLRTNTLWTDNKSALLFRFGNIAYSKSAWEYSELKTYMQGLAQYHTFPYTHFFTCISLHTSQVREHLRLMPHWAWVCGVSTTLRVRDSNISAPYCLSSLFSMGRLSKVSPTNTHSLHDLSFTHTHTHTPSHTHTHTHTHTHVHVHIHTQT